MKCCLEKERVLLKQGVRARNTSHPRRKFDCLLRSLNIREQIAHHFLAGLQFNFQLHLFGLEDINLCLELFNFFRLATIIFSCIHGISSNNAVLAKERARLLRGRNVNKVLETVQKTDKKHINTL